MIIDIVLFYCNGKGGMEKVITTVSNGLIKRGHKVRVFQAIESRYSKWEKDLSEYYCFRNGLSKNSSIKEYAKNYREYIQRLGEPDIILATHSPMVSMLCFLAVSFDFELPPLIVSWIHGPIECYGHEKSIRCSEAHLAISSNISEGIRKYTQEEEVYVVNNPVKVRGNSLVEREEEILDIIFIGRINNISKRIDIMLTALSKLDGEWRLRILGDGPDKREMMELAKKLKINHKVKWLGWYDEPWDVINKATVMLMTSDIEGFGLVLVEALSRGVPVISTRNSGAEEIIRDGVNGWIVEKNDIDEIVNKLKEVRDKLIYIPTQQECIDSVQKYDEDYVIDNIEKILIYKYDNRSTDKVEVIQNIIRRVGGYINDSEK